ncbi:MAG: proprotein convertase P-domain-containing protein [Undibacterium sp.]|nr:proprotein convertase P-domain-containing protein [Undibacterium sp.]
MFLKTGSHLKNFFTLGLCLLASISSAYAQGGKGPIPIAEAKSVHYNLSPSGEGIASNETVLRAATGASFVKVHFEYFNLPKGAVLEVADDSGGEVYRYASDKLAAHTVESKLGENGKTSFAAMSVNGEVAHLRLSLNGAKWDYAQHGVRIRRIMEGFSHEKIGQILNQTQNDVSSGGNTFSVCSNNDRKDAICYANSNPVEYERSRPVARLLMSGGLCTTWRVGSGNFLMTNNHCISTQAGAAASEVWFNYQNSTCGGSSLAPVTKVNGVSLLKTDATLDYSLYTINDLAAIASFGNFGLDVRPAVKDEQIFIPQHGGGNPKQLAIASDANTGNVCRIDAPIQNGNGTNTDAGYKCDTEGGSSGSPVVAFSSKKVIALHHLGGCPTGNNSGALINNIWPQIATYFNNVVPNGDTGTLPPTATPIGANVAVNNLAGAVDSEAYYVLDLTSAPSTLKFGTNGGSGDVNMYVKQGAFPTTTAFDCKSDSVGNTEACNITTPVASKYYVLLKAKSAYSAASLLATTTNTGVNFENTTRYNIPDNNSAGASSPITVPRTGDSGYFTVDVNIMHTYSGDLTVSLIAPNGKIFVLQSKQGGSADNIIKRFNVNAVTVASNGVWKLKVVDSAAVDTGYISSWKMGFAN